MLRPEQCGLAANKKIYVFDCVTILKKLIENTTAVSVPSWTILLTTFTAGWWRFLRMAMRTLSVNIRTPFPRRIANSLQFFCVPKISRLRLYLFECQTVVSVALIRRVVHFPISWQEPPRLPECNFVIS